MRMPLQALTFDDPEQQARIMARKVTASVRLFHRSFEEGHQIALCSWVTEPWIVGAVVETVLRCELQSLSLPQMVAAGFTDLASMIGGLQKYYGRAMSSEITLKSDITFISWSSLRGRLAPQNPIVRPQ